MFENTSGCLEGDALHGRRMEIHGASIKATVDTSLCEIISHKTKMSRVHIDAIVAKHTWNLTQQWGPSSLNPKVFLYHRHMIGI